MTAWKRCYKDILFDQTNEPIKHVAKLFFNDFFSVVGKWSLKTNRKLDSRHQMLSFLSFN